MKRKLFELAIAVIAVVLAGILCVLTSRPQ